MNLKNSMHNCWHACLTFPASCLREVHPEERPHLGVIQGIKPNVCRVCVHRHCLQQGHYFRLGQMDTPSTDLGMKGV